MQHLLPWGVKLSDRSWPRELSENLIYAYDDTLKLLTEVMPGMSGLYLSQRFGRFLDLEMRPARTYWWYRAEAQKNN